MRLPDGGLRCADASCPAAMPLRRGVRLRCSRARLPLPLTRSLVLAWAAHLAQYRFDALPHLGLLLVARLAEARSLLRCFGDGRGALRFKEVACDCRDIGHVH